MVTQWLKWLMSPEGIIWWLIASLAALVLWGRYFPHDQLDDGVQRGTAEATAENDDTIEGRRKKRANEYMKLHAGRVLSDDGTVAVRDEQDDAAVQTRTTTTKRTIRTSFGPVVVTHVKPEKARMTVITMHDFCMNHVLAFSSLWQVSKSKFPFKDMEVYHIDMPGHESTAETEVAAFPASMDEVVLMMHEIITELNLSHIIAFGVGAGANAILRYTIKYPNLILGAVLVHLDRRKPTISERINISTLRWMLRGWGMTPYVKKSIAGYFLSHIASYRPLYKSFLAALDQAPVPANLIKYIDTYLARDRISDQDLERLKHFSKAFLLVAGTSPNGVWTTVPGPNPVAGVTTMYMELDLTASTWFKVSGSGPLATFERPIALQEPITLFLQGLGFAQ